MTLPDTPPADPSPPVGHETSDVKIRGVLWLGAAVAAMIIVAQVGLWLLLGSYRNEAQQRDPLLSPLAAQRQPASGPKLQSSPNTDYAEWRRTQQESLESYGWIDKQQGVVRIPVARAMELLAERGLPTPAGPVAEPAAVAKPAESPQPE